MSSHLGQTGYRGLVTQDLDPTRRPRLSAVPVLPCFVRAGKEVEKRNLTLVDDTCTEISITLWGSTAKEDGGRWEGSPVVAFKGVKVR